MNSMNYFQRHDKLPANLEELQKRADAATRLALDECKLHGTPVVYSEHGRLIKCYPDGRRVELVGPLTDKKEVSYV